jgi:hypothetical protein
VPERRPANFTERSLPVLGALHLRTRAAPLLSQVVFTVTIGVGMMKPCSVALALSIAVSTAGCSLTATMLPVEGPLSVARPVPTLQVKVRGIMSNNGSLSFAMPDGEACAGRWSSAAGVAVAFGSASLLSQYGSTYISGYSLTAGGGQNPGQALVTCNRGRTFQLEFVTGANTAHGYGIGKDNQDNLYRFVF